MKIILRASALAISLAAGAAVADEPPAQGNSSRGAVQLSQRGDAYANEKARDVRPDTSPTVDSMRRRSYARSGSDDTVAKNNFDQAVTGPFSRR
ncbi:hypothetical protein [Arenibaculum pallidiluteum]|uniref:hypothetical protein n=1 Tax=Arenibaculum pallidiluteum TaxID=2812559 RepID=UPI001A966D22|nr:hypothetical protein [Arenibaculum pallidiluteum]